VWLREQDERGWHDAATEIVALRSQLWMDGLFHEALLDRLKEVVAERDEAVALLRKIVSFVVASGDRAAGWLTDAPGWMAVAVPACQLRRAAAFLGRFDGREVKR